MATGLVWTEVGGDVIFIEATKMKGKGALTLTGQLGDVMRESAQAAVSWIRANAADLGIDPAFAEEFDLHIHVPAAAIPKDGPSAGITMATALTSVLTGTKVRRDMAMTGEITLRGRVLPIGGLKEKLLAAHRAGIKTVLIPKENVRDLELVPEHVRTEMEIVAVDCMDDVLERALVRRAELTEAPGSGPCSAVRTRQATARPAIAPFGHLICDGDYNSAHERVLSCKKEVCRFDNERCTARRGRRGYVGHIHGHRSPTRSQW